MAQPNGNNLLSGSSDTPLNALRAGQNFWRYQASYAQPTPGISPVGLIKSPYIYLGNVVPSAVQIGSNSDIDTVRIWYVPQGNPSVAFYQDVSAQAPLTAPIKFYPQPISLNGAVVDPGCYIFFGWVPGALSLSQGDFFTYAPVAPRALANFQTTGPAGFGGTFIFLDLIVYFNPPDTFAPRRAPRNESSGLISAGSSSDPRTYSVASGAPPELIWSVPTFGRKLVNFQISASAASTFILYGHNYGVNDHVCLTLSNITETSYEGYPVDYEFMYLVCTAQGGGGGGITGGYTFEFNDD